jgi:transcription antitermination protein NusB
MGMGSRRRGREVALQVLYQLDVQEQLSDDAALALFWRSFATRDEEPVSSEKDERDDDDESRSFAEALVRGVRAELAAIDALLARASRNWRVERMARVDRNLLRLAVWELKWSKDVPAKVAINEAIEIAKRYGTAESPAFVNGILDRCLEEIGAR